VVSPELETLLAEEYRVTGIARRLPQRDLSGDYRHITADLADLASVDLSDLSPVLAEVGIKAEAPPAHFEVHNTFKR